jgi:hypothetical protein
MKRLTFIKQLIFAMAIVLVICNCKHSNRNIWIKDKSLNSPENLEAKASPLERLKICDTLKIMVTISDCGEWGGHHEIICVQKKDSQYFSANLKIDTVSCDKIHEITNRKIIIDTTLQLTKENEKIIIDFVKRLAELYFKEQLYSNAGDFYKVLDSDSSMRIEFWNSGDIYNTNYDKVRDIFLEK